MERNLLKLALCAMALLPIGAWAAEVTQISNYTVWTFAEYDGQTSKVYNYSGSGTEGTGLYLHSKESSGPVYDDFSTNVERMAATSGTFSNGIEWSATKALTCNRGVSSGLALGGINVTNTTSAANSSLAFRTTVAGKLYVIYGNTSTSEGKFYITHRPGSESSFTNLIEPVDMEARSTEDGYKYTLLESVATLTGADQIFMGADVAYCIYAIMFIPTTTYDESVDNTVKGGTYEITINRTLKKDVWNSIALPFAFNKEQMETFAGEGAQLASYSSISGTTESISLGFANMDISTSSTVAGRPYLIKPTEDCSIITFAGIVTATDQSQKRELTGGTASCKFSRIYSPTVLSTTDYYFADSNKLKQGNGTSKIKAFRGYMALEVKSSARGFNPDFEFFIEDGEGTTSIDHIEGLDFIVDGPAYNMNGQQVASTTKGLKSGLYIVNGKKYVVK